MHMLHCAGWRRCWMPAPHSASCQSPYPVLRCPRQPVEAVLAFPVEVLDPKWYPGKPLSLMWLASETPSSSSWPAPSCCSTSTIPAALPHVCLLVPRPGHCCSTGSQSRAVGPSLQPQHGHRSKEQHVAMLSTGNPTSSIHVQCQPFHMVWGTPEIRASSSTLWGSHHNEHENY